LPNATRIFVVLMSKKEPEDSVCLWKACARKSACALNESQLPVLLCQVTGVIAHCILRHEGRPALVKKSTYHVSCCVKMTQVSKNDTWGATSCHVLIAHHSSFAPKHLCPKHYVFVIVMPIIGDICSWLHCNACIKVKGMKREFDT
jgi:hypothetical protein